MLVVPASEWWRNITSKLGDYEQWENLSFVFLAEDSGLYKWFNIILPTGETLYDTKFYIVG